tara:strand:+ start:182 stop:319 length:138 start_codon:yes stop_codon:yes gene_type:complete
MHPYPLEGLDEVELLIEFKHKKTPPFLEELNTSSKQRGKCGVRRR